jgi:antitoxin HigA-1
MVEYAARKSTDRRPTHPGALLREDVLPALGVSITEAARQMNVTRQTLHRLLSETTAVTPLMALRLGRFCGNGPSLWMRMQEAYDLWHAEQEHSTELARIRPARVA